jgi:erythromycin esterase-like protein
MKRLSRKKRSTWPEPEVSDELLHEVESLSRPLHGFEDLDPLLERIGDARYVLLGEATHGTSEFYTWRRQLSQRLIREKGFSFIAVEGDWPDCYRVNRFAKNYPDAPASAREALHAFERWPTWMWANEEVVSLAQWLRQHNDRLPTEQKVGFYGLDVYSLWDSMHAVLRYLESNDGSTAAAARRAFECFEPYADDVQEYARATMWIPELCEDEVVDLLGKMRAAAPQFQHDGREAFFSAEQNALVAKNAEKYYRTMVRGDSPSWNVRDRHMVETLNRLMEHHGRQAKAIVWEHNTHIGDARATDMAAEGMVNVGQLVRQQQADDEVVLVGFSTYRGTVIAGREWGAAMESIPVPPGRPGSWEAVLHAASAGDKLLLLDRADEASPLWDERGHRAIGVVYRPQYEQYGNYVPTILPGRYDALLYIDETTSLRPLHMHMATSHDLPETFPSGV